MPGLRAAASLIHKGVKFSVLREPRVDRDGQTRDYDFITHPGAAVILPLLGDGRVLLIANQRPAIGQELLELPAGTLDHDEDPRVCAARELTEETGYRAGKLEPLLSFYSSPGFCDERLHAFLASDLQPGRTALEPGEDIRPVPLELEEALRLIGCGAICDAKSIVSLLWYDAFRRR